MITWSDNYIMGIKQFDYEHKQLFHLAEQILSKMRISNRNHPDTHMFVIREAVTYIMSATPRKKKPICVPLATRAMPFTKCSTTTFKTVSW